MRSSPRRRPGLRRIDGFLDPGFHRDDLFRVSLEPRFQTSLRAVQQFHQLLDAGCDRSAGGAVRDIPPRELSPVPGILLHAKGVGLARSVLHEREIGTAQDDAGVWTFGKRIETRIAAPVPVQTVKQSRKGRSVADQPPVCIPL